MNHAIQDSKDLIERFQTFLKLKVFVPEGMSEEVETNAGSTPLEESNASIKLAIDPMNRGVEAAGKA